MKICVAIPAYKAQETIERCIASIAIQNVIDDIHVIIASDEPNENYAYLKSKFPKLKIDTLAAEKNTGVGACRTRALNACDDDLITFIDSDDVFFSPLSIQHMAGGFNAPNVVCVQSVFLQEAENLQVATQNNINHPWVFGRMYNVRFLKEFKIDFSDLRQMEDGYFNWCLRLVIDGTQFKINYINEITYLWKCGGEHSITRSGAKINNGTPVYNFGMCQVGAVIACTKAIEKTLERNPFASVQKFAIEQFMSLYFTYYESLEKNNIFSEQLLYLARFFYSHVVKKYCQNITNEMIEKFFMQALQFHANKLSKFPNKTITQFIESLREFEAGEIETIREKIPNEIKEVEKTTGTYSENVFDFFKEF